jgi:hypothetical protein
MQLTITTEQRITNTLLLNASFIGNIGLLHGKMGISICFYHLARQAKNRICEDYAGELIDEIYEEITANTPIDFENGLAGIGYGIEYLVQNGFIEADTDEVLEEFDNRIFKELIYNTPRDIGLLNGLAGIGTYFLKRIKNPASGEENIPTLTNKQALIHIIDELDRKTQNIAEIILEPLSSSNNHQTFEQLSNPRTLEQQIGAQRPNGHRDRSGGATNKLFDLTWDYPALLWSLSELYEQNIFNFKVEKIIKRFTEPLSNESNFPKLQSNRLLLALALTKLQQTNSGQPTTNDEPQTTNSVRPGIHEHSEMNSTGRTPVRQGHPGGNPESAANRDNEQQTTNNIKPSNYSNQVELSNFSNIEKRISNLLYGINRNTINSELPPHNTTLRYGNSGIAWIYQQLHCQRSDNHFKEEMEYWHQLPFISEKPYEVLPGINNESLNAWGLLEGLAGMLLNIETINVKEPKKQ